ncbi:MAG: N-6 DNA methylase [Ardenticatenaceae bacterium]|nr:N-6 DNA methylase [Ardenticatenaceae bacterium]
MEDIRIVLDELFFFQLPNMSSPQPSQGEGWDGGETDLLYWKRRVVEACIYGVDKNPMAVELAKLSLWLKTAAADKPLSFLDHHLQHGDSLIGAWLADLHTAPRPQGFSKGSSPSKVTGSKPLGSEAHQQPLFDDSAFTRDAGLAVGGVMAIERATTNSIDDVHLKEQMWRELQQTHIARWRRLADLWVSAYFGNAMTSEEYRALVAYLQHFPGNSKFPGKSEFLGKSEPGSSLLTEAQRNHFLQHPAVTNNDYFHWELAFPEVFFDEYGRSRHAAAGFDAVIGNPPYGKPQETQKDFLKQRYKDVLRRLPDMFAYFSYQSLLLCNSSGMYGNIVPQVLLFQSEYSLLRSKLILEHGLSQVIDLGDGVFADATVPTSIVICDGFGADNKLNIANLREDPEKLSTINQEFFLLQTSAIQKSDDLVIPTTRVAENALLQEILSRDFAQSFDQLYEIAQAVQTGGDKFFVVSNSTAKEKGFEEKYLRPVIFGSDIDQYSVHYKGDVLLYISRDVQSSEIQTILEYLRTHKAKLSKVSEVKAGIRPWYTIHRPRNPNMFEQEKITLRQTGDTLYDEPQKLDHRLRSNKL